MTPCDVSLKTDIAKIIENINATPAITPEDGVWPNCDAENNGGNFGLAWLQGNGGGRNKTKSRRKTKKGKKKDKRKSRRRRR